MEIIELIEAKGIHYVIKPDGEIAIVCPHAANHQGGVDARPSFNINADRLVSHCFACGFSLKGDDLLQWLTGGALEELDFRTMAIRAKIKQIEHTSDVPLSEARQVLIPPGDPWDEDGFRGISIDTYRKLGAIRCNRGWYDNRIVFPIYLGGELIGVDARALKDDMKPKYLRNKGSSCGVDWLYPYDIVKEMKPNYVILGEGIFHSVNGVGHGFPTLCFFGANNWSRTKLRMVLALNVDYVVMFADNDKAGIKAEQEICSMISNWLPVYSTNTSRVPEGKDLGDLSKDEISWAIENKVKASVPLCLPDRKPELGSRCSMHRCNFIEKGKCQNVYW